jgi:amino acid transporter
MIVIGLDDRVGHLHHLSGIIAIERRTRVAPARVGRCWFAHHYWRALLLGACDYDAARRRRLCFSTRSLRSRRLDFCTAGHCFLLFRPGTIAAVAIAFAKFLGVFVPSVSPDNYLIAPISFGGYAISLSLEQLVAIALIALLTWTNTRGLEVGKIIQNTFHLL